MKPDVVGKRSSEPPSSPGGAFVRGVHLGSDRATERVSERLRVHHNTVDSKHTFRIETLSSDVFQTLSNSLVNDEYDFTFQAEVYDNRAQRREYRPRQSYWNSKSAT